MQNYHQVKDVLIEFFPLHRTLVSDDMDKTLEIIGKCLATKFLWNVRDPWNFL